MEIDTEASRLTKLAQSTEVAALRLLATEARARAAEAHARAASKRPRGTRLNSPQQVAASEPAALVPSCMSGAQAKERAAEARASIDLLPDLVELNGCSTEPMLRGVLLDARELVEETEDDLAAAKALQLH
eukprot:4149810-Prymnesium_polylepis.1